MALGLREDTGARNDAAILEILLAHRPSHPGFSGVKLFEKPSYCADPGEYACAERIGEKEITRAVKNSCAFLCLLLI